MKKIVTILSVAVAMMATAHTYAQSCCAKPASSGGMQALALNRSFKASHEAPLPMSYAATTGAMIHFPTKGGANGNAFFIPAEVKSNKVLIMVHEWWGLNDYIKKEAETWQKELGKDVAVYAIDLYDGRVATTADEAGKIMNKLDPKRAEAIINGALAKIGKNKKIATVGWCMGGSWSFTASVLAGNDASGCVMYYGFPEKDPARAHRLKTDLLYIYGRQDDFIQEADVQRLGDNVRESGHQFELHSYDAVHAFANPSNPNYNVQAATEAHGIALKFVLSHLEGQ